MKNKETFEDKVFQVVFILLAIKLFYALFSATYLPTKVFFISVLGTLFIAFLLLVFLRAFKKGFNFESDGDFRNRNQNNSNGSGSNVLLQSSVFNKIEQKYRTLAQEYVDQKEYKKAANVYMKLLKDNYSAANVLYNGELYLEAATINLKYLKNEPKAAECFEKGKAYKDALHLYLKLNNQEKVGDMYMNMNAITEAKEAYYKEVGTSIASGQYIKASQLLRSKIKTPKEAQELLLEGWDKNIQRNECLTAYFQNLSSKKPLDIEIQNIYETKTSPFNKEAFFGVLKTQFGKNKEVNKKVRTISYEIVSQLIDKRPEMASELNYLNAENKSFTKDVLKYKLNRRGRV